ncbi:MAG: hypothetical protein AAGA60_26315 [Cyanobacteria bacterium P01_E01_bin.42]
MSQIYIEIKTRYLDAGDARKIIEKQTIVSVICTDKISKPAKKLFDEAGIVWAENVKKENFNCYKDREN